ncbi:hypothetical protein KUTeg_018987 [Tegillarca granosa]|uniref:Eukaryotic translation initiation factor 2-alpha kinase 1 n=1 Tax=Tegillarca granosa TaxID=220873 RepID=A0ABQ9EFG1_TEGGR|nr:hypothetical protein KUTeg_018987 [Tegillarca granosa]
MAIPRATPKGRIGPSTLSQFSMKGGPKSIHKFDDSDMSESVSSSGASSLPVEVLQDNNQCSTVLPRSVPSHLLMISILEQLCMLYAKDSGKGIELFNLISEHLIRLKICSPLTLLDAMGSIRSQYRLFMHNVLKSSLQPLPAHLDISIPRVESRVPLMTNEDILQSHTSRYKTEFTEIEKIGKGGFGSVFKARHNLDGRIYAIKKIKFKHSRPEIWMRVLREVKALANLQHVNIVGYNAAWLENVHNVVGFFPVFLLTESAFSSGKATEDSMYRPPEESINPRTQNSETDDSVIFAISSSQQDNVISVQDSLRITELKSRDNFGSSSSSEFCVACEESRNNSTEGRPKIGFVKKHSCTLKFFQNEFPSTSPNGKLWDEINMNTFWNKRLEMKRSLSCDPYVSTEKSDKNAVIKHNLSEHFLDDLACSRIQVTLYIQMELCSLTLKEWMERRNQRCADLNDFKGYAHVNMKIFKQILKGVDYIHSNGIIHRDLKPRNIFLHEPELHVKIGDFGLAKGALGSDYKDEVLLTPTPDSEKNINWDDHTSGVGTSTYAAPEQLQSSVYSIKSDIYSLGVILYEEFHMFKTDMEKFHCLDCLRNGEIDDTTCKYWPNQIITDLKGLLRDKEKEIEQLKAMLKKRDEVINTLKQDIDSQIQNFKK